MGFFNFRKRIKIAPGISLNLGKKGASVSVGPRGLKTTIGSKGARTTIGLPGTGLSYTHVHNSNNTAQNYSGTRKTSTCPNCGHRMRKQWNNCPKCNYFLANIYQVQQNDTPTRQNLNNATRTGAGGCLLQILLIIFTGVFCLYKVMDTGITNFQ